MITSRFTTSATALASALALLALAASLPAQTSRTSNTSRSTSSSSSSRARTGTNSGNYSSGSASSSGMRQYPSNTMMGDALIQIDPETRSVVVVSDDATHAEIAKVIANLDHPKPQVLIKVVFIEVSLDKSLDVGLEGSYTFDVGHTAGTSGSSAAGTLFGLANQTANGAFGRISSDNWNATLHMLATSGKAQVLSRPSIMARNNQQAVIVVGKEVPLVTGSQITADGQTINSITYQDVGIILRVTPFITSDKSVEMIVAPEISSLSDQTVDISANVKAPVINKRSAETVVVTPNATTVVIGGLMQKEVTSSVKKIPILGDIPLLGHAFRRTVKQDTRSELLIFLTPYIVESNQKLREVTMNEANHAELTRETLTPEDIRDNLDTLRLIPQPDPLKLPKTEVKVKTKFETKVEPALPVSAPAKR